MSKKLLKETVILGHVANSKLLTESGRKSPGYCILENVQGKPLRIQLAATVLDEENENGRTYGTPMMENCLINEATKLRLEGRELLSTVDGHPEDVFVEPGNASHIVTRAWVENGFLMNEWEVLETSKGKDLRALVEGKARFGVSIRGLGSQDNFGNILEDYEYYGTDCVGNPSARLFVTPKIVESSSPAAKAKPEDKTMFKTLREATAHIAKQGELLASTTDTLDRSRILIKLEEDINATDLGAIDNNRMLTEYSALRSKYFETASSTTATTTKQPITESTQTQTAGDDLSKEVEKLQSALAGARKTIESLRKTESLKLRAAKARITALTESASKRSGNTTNAKPAARNTVKAITPVVEKTLRRKAAVAEAKVKLLARVMESVKGGKKTAKVEGEGEVYIFGLMKSGNAWLPQTYLFSDRTEAEQSLQNYSDDTFRPKFMGSSNGSFGEVLGEATGVRRFFKKSKKEDDEDTPSADNWFVSDNLEPETEEETPASILTSEDGQVSYIYAPDEENPYKAIDTGNGTFISASSVEDLADKAAEFITSDYALAADEISEFFEVEPEDTTAPSGDDYDNMTSSPSGDDSDDELKDDMLSSPTAKDKTEATKRQPTFKKESSTVSLRIKKDPVVGGKTSVVEQKRKTRELTGLDSNGFI